MPGFGPAAELVVWRIPKGATFVVEGKGPNNGRALRDAPCNLTPRPASLKRTDASLGRAVQLATLKQGPPTDESVPHLGQTAGVGPWETNISVTHMKESETTYSV